MPTVIDELIVVLGLDATKFTQEQRKVIESWRKTREASVAGGKEVEKGLEGVADTAKMVTTRFLALGALFAGGLGIKKFTDDIRNLATEMTNLDRQAKNANLTAQQFYKFGQAGKALGLNPAEVQNSILALQREVAHFQVFAGGNPMIVQALKQFGITPQDLATPEGTEKALSAINRRANQLRAGGSNQAQINAYLSSLGISEGSAALFSQPEEKFQRLLKLFKDYAPDEAQIRAFEQLQEHATAAESAVNKLALALKAGLVPQLSGFYDWVKSIADYFLGFTGKKEHPLQPGTVYPGTGTEGVLPGVMPEGSEIKGKPDTSGALRSIWDNTLGSVVGSAHGAPSVGSEGGGGILSQGNISIPGMSGSGGGLAGDRAKYMAELQRNPELRQKMLAIAAAENNDPTANLAVMETMMNRASARGTTLAEQLKFYGRERGGYYPTANYAALRDPKKMAMLESNLGKAFGGSNVSNYATDNSSGSLAVRDEVSGAFIKTIPTQNGESFFSPGNRGRGSASRSAYESWRQGLGRSNAFEAGAPPVPFGDWLTNAQTRNMMKVSGITTTNNRTSNETTVGNINVQTQATDAYGIARDLKPYLTNNDNTQSFNYGPN